MKIEKGKDGYEDKNDVGDFLTPNEQSSGYKNFVKLSNGDFGVTAAPAQRQGGGGFGGTGGTPVAPAPALPGFGRQSDRPLDSSNTTMTSPSEAPQPSRAAFNPNQAPAFLR